LLPGILRHRPRGRHASGRAGLRAEGRHLQHRDILRLGLQRRRLQGRVRASRTCEAALSAVPLNFRPLPRDYQPLDVALEAKSPADRDKLVAKLERMASEDSGFRSSIDKETGQARLHMASESQLEATVGTLAKEGLN